MRAALRVCGAPGCSALVERGRCAAHRRARYQAQDRNRSTSAARGYGASWRRLRLMQLRASPLCVACGRPATEVDHIRPLALGGTNEAGNLRSLCKPCHSAHTMRTRVNA
jgi:5-methylcytosine-specific restriction protein A